MSIRFSFGGDEHIFAEVSESMSLEAFFTSLSMTNAVREAGISGVTEICPAEGFYDYAAKYTEGKAVHVCPAQLPPEWTAMVQDYAVRAHRALGCRGASRADFRLDDSDPKRVRCIILEVNTQPGMTPLSLVPEQARAAGMSFAELVSWMVEAAQCDS